MNMCRVGRESEKAIQLEIGTEIKIYVYMTGHAGPRLCECHPGTKFWHPPVEVTPFWHPRSGFGARFLFERPNKNKFSMKQNSNWNHFQQLLIHTFPPPLDQYNIFWPSQCIWLRWAQK